MKHLRNLRTKSLTLVFVALSTFLLQGCVAFPPLIQVEHKHDAKNDDLMRRLDSIDQRLSQLEQKADKKE